MNDKDSIPVGRHYILEDTFESFIEYQEYLMKVLALFQDQKKKRTPSLKKFVPEFLEIEFSNSIKAPRAYIPRYRGTLVIQVPAANRLAPRKKAILREKMLMRFMSSIKVNELSVADEIAMRMKLIDTKKASRRKRYQ